jgi:hypothetical protein
MEKRHHELTFGKVQDLCFPQQVNLDGSVSPRSISLLWDHPPLSMLDRGPTSV